MIKRCDLVHPLISGNKWYKLKYNLLAARERGHDTLLSFGGAYSNHIYALAAAAKEYGFRSIGVIRGERHQPLNATLQFASDCGMQLHYINRADYREKHSELVAERLRQQFGRFYLIPEGGSNALAVQGCAEILQHDGTEFDVLACACGTGGTLAGLIAANQAQYRVIGIPVLKGADFLYQDIRQLVSSAGISEPKNWQLQLGWHHGGYAKTSSELIEFIRRFEQQQQIALEPVYTGKLLYALYQLIQQQYFAPGTRVLAIHSGGLQGRDSLMPG